MSDIKWGRPPHNGHPLSYAWVPPVFIRLRGRGAKGPPPQPSYCQGCLLLHLPQPSSTFWLAEVWQTQTVENLLKTQPASLKSYFQVDPPGLWKSWQSWPLIPQWGPCFLFIFCTAKIFLPLRSKKKKKEHVSWPHTENLLGSQLWNGLIGYWPFQNVFRPEFPFTRWKAAEVSFLVSIFDILLCLETFFSSFSKLS